MSPRMDQTMGRARGMMSGFTPGQRGVVAVAAIALVVGAVALSRWAAQPSWAPLFGNLSGTDASAIVDQLQSDGVAYKLTDGGATVLVPQESVYDERVKLSGAGLPSTGSNGGGYSILDKQGITATDFQQNVAYRRALEGELNKTLEAFEPVQTAVVHVAMPKRDVFSSDEDKPTASVLLSLKAGKELSREQVQSVTHLVGGAVENLDPADVTVTDAAGKLLSGDGTGDIAGAAGDADAQTASYENRISGALQKMLDTVLGAGHSVVRVNAALDFDATDTTTESAVSNPTALPSSSSETTETYTTDGAAGANGTLGQIFAGEETLTGGGTGTSTTSSGTSGTGQYSKTAKVLNNSVGKAVSRTVATPGSVKKMSVAVVLDATTAGATDPTTIETLVANAVGLDTKRGDTVDVSKLAFDTTDAKEAAKELKAAESADKMSGYLDIGKKAGLGLLIILALLVAIRSGKKKPGTTTVTAAPVYTPQPELLGVGAGVGGGSPMAIGAGQSALPASTPAGGDDTQRAINQLVENQPDDVAAMLQSWLAERRV